MATENLKVSNLISLKQEKLQNEKEAFGGKMDELVSISYTIL